MRKSRGALPWILGGLGALGLLVVAALVIVVAVGSSDPADDAVSTARDVDDSGSGVDPGSGDAIVDDPMPDVGGESDEIDDVAPCEYVDAETIRIDVTNDSSEQSNYIIDVNFLDADGQRVGDEPFFVNHLRPGERAVERKFVFDSGGGVSCEIVDVERFASRTVDDLSDASCEVDGVDFADDLKARFVATNNSSEVSDYLIEAAFIRDGIRIGTSFGSIDNVRPGQSAPGDGFSFVPGPDTGVTCQVIHVERLAST